LTSALRAPPLQLYALVALIAFTILIQFAIRAALL